MKQSLQLKIGQQLTMTPQLQQAIRLLQLSTLDLQHEIQEALDTNPMLELPEDNTDSNDGGENNTQNEQQAEPIAEAPASAAASDDSQQATTQDAQDSLDTASADTEWTESIPSDLPVDSSWDDVYQPTPAPVASGSGSGIDDDDKDFDRNGTTESLQEHLLWQLNLTPMSDTDRLIAITIIDAIEPNGMLSLTAEDIHTSFDPSAEIELDEVMAVLHLLQQFDPPGVASHDLRECLMIQLRQLPKDTPWRSQAMHIIHDYIELLGSRDYKTLMRRVKLKEHELKDAIQLIQTLNPAPGEQIASQQAEYIVPDVFVSKKEGRWVVELNPDIAPRLRINSDYASLVKRADSSNDNTYLRDHLQEARWFLKSLQSRNETLMKVASKVVEYQQGFLEYGEEAMKPLVLHDIAEAVEMHESTISRVTTQKYMHTPRGIFELKYFFSSHVSTTGGGECSSTAIRALIKKLIAAEDPKKPLSDSKITNLLEEQGIKVARRTIAKYRESLNIPPSNERKRLV